MGIDLNALSRAVANAIVSRRWGRVLALLIAAGLAAAGLSSLGDAPKSAQAQPQAQGTFLLKGRVVHIADGDTFTVLVQGKQQRIRMASIDAPETTKDADRPGQPFADASRDALEKLLAGKTLTLTCYERDRYNRSICDVPLDDGSTANRRQVEAGMAWANMEGKGKFLRDDTLRDLERQARQRRRGIWASPGAERPWVWRYQCWQKHQC